MFIQKHYVLFHIPSLVYAVISGAVLFFLVRSETTSIPIVGAYAGALGVLTLIAARIITGHIFLAIVPVGLLLGVAGLIFFMDGALQRVIAVGVVTILAYAAMLGSHRVSRSVHDAVARGMVIAAATMTLFLWYALIFAVYMNYVIPRFMPAIASGVITAVIAWQYFIIVVRGSLLRTVIYAGAIALVVGQVAWSVAMWPFGYLTNAVIMLMVYYVLWDMCHCLFCQQLSRSRAVVNIITLLIVATLVLMSAQWRPIV